jgi:glycerate kinase
MKQILGGETVKTYVCGVFGERMAAEYLMLSDKTAVVEMAVCAGLPLAGDNKNPEKATTFGVGELIKHAVSNGAEKIILGLGGSATNDCGLGMASALGWRFADEKGNEFVPTGETMCKIMHITAPPNIISVPVIAACDVENPLCGENGAAYVFAPQKGADEEMVKRLDVGLRHVAEIIKNEADIDVTCIKGAGAAGGMGAGAVAFLDAELKKGIDILLDAAEFDRKVVEADLIITGHCRNQLEQCSHIVTHIFHFCQFLRRCFQNSGKRTELLDQFMGNLIGVPLGDAVKQKQFQNLMFFEIIQTVLQKPLFQPLSVSCVNRHIFHLSFDSPCYFGGFSLE